VGGRPCPCPSHPLPIRFSYFLPAGADHLVLADQGCRNTVFNAQAQTGLPFLPSLLAAGLGAFRVELVDEPAQHVGPLLEAYREALAAAAELAQHTAQLGAGAGAEGRWAGGAGEGGASARLSPAAQRARREWEAAERRAWALLQVRLSMYIARVPCCLLPWLLCVRGIDCIAHVSSIA
jgi:hypothetical protein